MERDATWTKHCRFVGMHGSFFLGYGGGTKPDAETNVRVDPAALRTVLLAPWQDILLTPLDTCGLLHLKGEHFQKIWRSTGDPLLRGVIENNCIFASRVPWMHYADFTRKSSTLFDSVAVYLAYDESLVEITPMRFQITDDGFTIPDENGRFKARVALKWNDLAAMEHHLTEILLGQAKQPET